MKKYGNEFSFIHFLMVILLGLIFQTTVSAQSRNALQKAPGVKAPDFILKDIKGNKFKLSDHKGKPVLLIFSTTWCGYCRSEIPHFKEIYSNYTTKGLVVVNVDINESQEKVSRFAAHYQLPYRVVLDEDGAVADAYLVRGVPTMTLIDGKGNVVCLYCRPVEPHFEKLFDKTNNPVKK